MPMANSSIAIVVAVLPVSNLTRAIDFYDLLGFTSKRYQDGDAYALHQSRRPLTPPHQV
jgi:predicted lactoylglutathione lyase